MSKQSTPKQTKSAPRRAPKRKQSDHAPLTAANADKYQLYQWAVQSPESDIAWLVRLYRRRRGHLPRHLREDFGGTGLLSCTWVKRGKRYTADAYDIDPEPIAWGREHNHAPLSAAAAGRMRFLLEDARAPSERQPDVRVALNFSYFIFKQRAELLTYFRGVREDLGRDGMFVLDIYGGPEAFHETEEERVIHHGFTYIWEQEEYWPATGDYLTHIHFRFEDESELSEAFTYDWRLWGLPEIIDLLRDAGFAKVETYWEGTDATSGGGNGVYRKRRLGENCLAWVTYIVCWAD